MNPAMLRGLELRGDPSIDFGIEHVDRQRVAGRAPALRAAANAPIVAAATPACSNRAIDLRNMDSSVRRDKGRLFLVDWGPKRVKSPPREPPIAILR